MTAGGKTPIRLANGETRTFLENGDTVTLKAFCERPGARRIGFGTCAGTVLPARSISDIELARLADAAFARPGA